MYITGCAQVPSSSGSSEEVCNPVVFGARWETKLFGGLKLQAKGKAT